MDYPALMDPRTMGILSAAFAGMNAAGPQRMPVSMGQVIGQGGMAGLGAYQGAMEAQRKAEQTQALINIEQQKTAMEKLKVDAAARQAALQESILGPLLGRLRSGGVNTPANTATSPVGSPSQSGAAPSPSSPSLPSAGGGITNPGVLGLGLDELAGLKAAGFPDLLEYYKANEPNIDIKDGVMVDKRTGRVVGTLPFGNAAGQVVMPRFENGQWTVTPVNGSVQTYSEFKDAEEAAKARRTLVKVPPTSPDQPPREMTLEQRVKQVQGAPSLQGQVGDANLNIADLTPTMLVNAITNADKDPETFKLIKQALQKQAQVGQTQSPSGAGQAAGMSPQQEAQQAADAAQGKSVAENYGKIYNDLQNASMQNPAKIAKFQKIGDLLAGFEGGKYSKTGYELARAANSLGFKIDSKLPNKEAAEAMASEVALELRSTGSGAGMPGAMSDADRDFLKGMAPNMAQTDQGRRAIISARVKVMERESKVAEMAREYRKRFGKIDDDFFSQLQGWSNRNPVFGKK